MSDPVGIPSPAEAEVMPYEAMNVDEHLAYIEFRDAARQLKDATATMNAAQERYRAAVGRLSSAAAP